MTDPPSQPLAPRVTPLRLKFPARRRLRRGSDFAQVFAGKTKAANGKLLMFARRNDLGYTRIGLSVSRRHGNAVARHRLRRLLREAYRLSQHDIPEGFDLILIPLPHPAPSVQQFGKSMIQLAGRLAHRLRSD